MVLMAFCTVNFFFSNMAVSDHYHYYSYMYNRKRSVAEFGRKNKTANTSYKYYSSPSPSIVSFIIICFALGRVPRLISIDIAYASCELIASPFEDKALLFVKIGRGR